MGKELWLEVHRNWRIVQSIYSQLCRILFPQCTSSWLHIVTKSVCSRVGLFFLMRTAWIPAPVYSEISHCEEGGTNWEELYKNV